MLDLRTVQMFPGAFLKLRADLLICPDHTIGMIFQICQQREIMLPFRQIVALAAVDRFCCGMKIPEFIVRDIGPRHEMIDGKMYCRKCAQAKKDWDFFEWLAMVED